MRTGAGAGPEGGGRSSLAAGILGVEAFFVLLAFVGLGPFVGPAQMQLSGHVPHWASDLGALLGAPATFVVWMAIGGGFLIGACQIAQSRSETSDRCMTVVACLPFVALAVAMPMLVEAGLAAVAAVALLMSFVQAGASTTVAPIRR